MLSSEDAATEPVFTCEFCEDLEDELTTSKKHCKHLKLVNKKLTAMWSVEKACVMMIQKVQYYKGLPSYEIL